MKLVNIACGTRYNNEWINFDFHANSKEVQQVNLLAGLPCKDNSADVVYSSHFLEHLSLKDGELVLREIYRILKYGGIVRIVVPDLENLCVEYLEMLKKVSVNEKYVGNYEWIKMELLDQLVRIESGGEMWRMFERIVYENNKQLGDYVQHRIGYELFNEIAEKNTLKNKITIAKIKNRLLYFYLGFVKNLIPKHIRKQIISNVAIGEKHLVMFDKYSLKKLLTEVGFKDAKAIKYNESTIPGFNDYLLDIKEDGSPYKGVSSLYMEAVK